MARTAGILLAGGTGSRMGSPVPKQLLPLGGRKVLEYALDVFVRSLDITAVVAHPAWMEEIRAIASLPGVIFAPGGDTRQLSVLSGLNALQGSSPDVVAVHDGARPFVTFDLLARCIASALKNGSGVAGLMSRSTVAVVENGRITRFIPRETVSLVQTPQAFLFPSFIQAHRLAASRGETGATDDSQLFLAAGQPLFHVEGDSSNIKITDPIDLKFASALADVWMLRENLPDPEA